MPTQPCDPHHRVLIVDSSEDTRTVLRTVLQRRGVQTLETAKPAEGLEFLRRFRPAVVVVDVESTPLEPHRLEQLFCAESADVGTRVIVLGAATPRRDASAHQVRKPYHYGPLVRKIEQLVREAQPAATGSPPLVFAGSASQSARTTEPR